MTKKWVRQEKTAAFELALASPYGSAFVLPHALAVDHARKVVDYLPKTPKWDWKAGVAAAGSATTAAFSSIKPENLTKLADTFEESVPPKFSSLPKVKKRPETAQEKKKNTKWAKKILRENTKKKRGPVKRGQTVQFRSFNDLAKITRLTNAEFSKRDFQVLFAPMIKAWTENPNFKKMTIVNNNWTQNKFHTKLLLTERAYKMPDVSRLLRSTFKKEDVPSIIRDMYLETEASSDDLVMESLRIDFSEDNGFEVRLYDKKKATKLDEYTFLCEKALECATKKQLMQKCKHHEHFVVAEGTILLTQLTDCDIGSENLKTYSVAETIQETPPVQTFESVHTIEKFDPTRPEKSPASAPYETQDYWYDAKNTEESGTIRWRTAEWKKIDRSEEAPLKRWEMQRSNGEWVPLHVDEEVLKNIETAYMEGRRMLPYHLKYKKPRPDRHEFVIDFGEMHQIDIFFPADVNRQNKIRRTVVRA